MSVLMKTLTEVSGRFIDNGVKSSLGSRVFLEEAIRSLMLLQEVIYCFSHKTNPIYAAYSWIGITSLRRFHRKMVYPRERAERWVDNCNISYNIQDYLNASDSLSPAESPAQNSCSKWLDIYGSRSNGSREFKLLQFGDELTHNQESSCHVESLV